MKERKKNERSREAQKKCYENYVKWYQQIKEYKVISTKQWNVFEANKQLNMNNHGYIREKKERKRGRWRLIAWKIFSRFFWKFGQKIDFVKFLNLVMKIRCNPSSTNKIIHCANSIPINLRIIFLLSLLTNSEHFNIIHCIK